MAAVLALGLALGLASAGAALAESYRIATWNVELGRKGPGLLAKALDEDGDPQVEAVVQGLAALDADVLLLVGVDYDRDLAALGLLADRLAIAGNPYPYRLAFRPNTGTQTGLDLDGDGTRGGPGDAQGWGLFAGQSGMAVLSRLPLDEAAARDFSGFLWADLPGNLMPPDTPAEVAAVQRLSTTGHWDVPVITGPGQVLHLLAFAATPPVFDGPEDRNGRRNHDEIAFWTQLLDGRLPALTPPPAPFVVLGTANLDPADGDGLTAGIKGLLAHGAVQDPAPRNRAGRTDQGQRGDPALDTALFDFGGLRVDYVLPSAGLEILGAGVLWPPDGDPLASVLAQASRHRPVWVEVRLP